MKRRQLVHAIHIEDRGNSAFGPNTAALRNVLGRLNVRHQRDVRDVQRLAFQASRVGEVAAALEADGHLVYVAAVLS